MLSILSELIYRPILNLTILIYSGLGGLGFADLGVAIVLMTIVIRGMFLPLSLKTARSQKTLAALAPEIERIKEEHKADKTKQSEAIMQMYKDRKINPLSGCLPLLIQLPILIGVYQVFLNIFKPESLEKLYPFAPHPATINHLFLGFMDISKPIVFFAIAAGALQFLQARLTSQNNPQTGQAAVVNQQMMYLFPVMIVVISWKLPAGLALYWVTTTIFSIGEQLYLRRQ